MKTRAYPCLRVTLSALLTWGLASASLASGVKQTYVELPGHIPQAAVANAARLGHVDATQSVTLALALPLRNQAELNELLQRLYDPADPLYGHYLTPETFTARFGPTQADYEAVATFARQAGLTIVGTHPNRTLLNVSGPAKAVENAFHLRLSRYRAMTGRDFYAPDNEPSVPAPVAKRLSGVIGLDSATVWKTHSQQFVGDGWHPNQIGTGPGSALTPSDIKNAYNLSGSSLNGSGQTLALFELDGYTASDITKYESYYGLRSVPLQNVLVGASGRAGSGASEVTLDIELMIALAPGATKIIVYEGPNTNAGVVNTYNRIATDNLAKSISTSWGLAESSNSASTRNAENTAFQQMAAQGQSIYAASGDSGAYDNGSSLSVDDPASQPYMVGVGGTSLATNGAGGTWQSETTWNRGSASAGAGGGGISVIWSLPSYQQNLAPAASYVSTTKRNVPDVALDADPYTGYSIYYRRSWYIFGGTSCAAPLWAAFTALINQQRAAIGKAPLGFANPAVYAIGKGTSYTTNFHDIADGSTNLYYQAVTGYDCATGWGSFNGASLLASLVAY